MKHSIPALTTVVSCLSRLPGIGEKTAQRLAYYILRADMRYAETLATSILDLKKSVRFCSTCLGFTDIDPCQICANPKRSRSVICIVADPQDIMYIERTHEFNGRYHILHGLLSPLNGITPDKLKVTELLRRISEENTEEVILALNSSVEGEATSLYLSRILKPSNIKVTKLASGIPMGSTLEFIDELTLKRALEARREA